MGKTLGRLALALAFLLVRGDLSAQEPPPSDPPTDDSSTTDDADAMPVPRPDLVPNPNPPTREYVTTVRAPVRAPGGAILPDTTSVDTNQFHASGDPVLGSGEFVLTKTDLQFAGFGMPFEFTRVYRNQVQYQGPLGYGTDTLLLELSRETLSQYLEQRPRAAMAILRTMATRLRETNTLLSDRVTKNAVEALERNLTWKDRLADKVAELNGSYVAFILDTTGSMSEEIAAVKSALERVAGGLDGQHARVRAGLVEYRDRGDEFVTRVRPLTTDVAGLARAIAGVQAGGGGDMPESVNEALHVALSKLDWDPDAVARLAFLAYRPDGDRR